MSIDRIMTEDEQIAYAMTMSAENVNLNPMTEDEQIAYAITMSVGESTGNSAAVNLDDSGTNSAENVNFNAMTEDEQIAYTMRMSMLPEFVNTPSSTEAGDEKMEFEEQSGDIDNEDNYSEATNNQALSLTNEKCTIA